MLLLLMSFDEGYNTEWCLTINLKNGCHKLDVRVAVNIEL